MLVELHSVVNEFCEMTGAFWRRSGTAKKLAVLKKCLSSLFRMAGSLCPQTQIIDDASKLEDFEVDVTVV